MLGLPCIAFMVAFFVVLLRSDGSPPSPPPSPPPPTPTSTLSAEHVLGAVCIPSYPDANCVFPNGGVAGALESVGDGRVLYVSNCHNMHLFHSVNDATGTVQSTPVTSNLANVTAPNDMLKFTDFDANRSKVYISFLRIGAGSTEVPFPNVPSQKMWPKNGCVSLSIVVCAFGEPPLGDAPSANCSTLYDWEPIEPACGPMNIHAAGGQLMSTEEGELLFTVGDLLQDPSQAQNDTSFYGKIWRAPLDKEPLEVSDFAMVSKGNRNPQGLCPIDDANKVLETEHGPKGGDEINVLDLDSQKVTNYGWPLVSYGDHYNGTDIPDKHAPNYTEPIAFFPYGLVGSHGISVCEKWDGYYLIASLNGNNLYTMILDSSYRVSKMTALNMGQRVRSIARLDDCFALLITEVTASRIDEKCSLVHVNSCGRNLRWAVA